MYPQSMLEQFSIGTLGPIDLGVSKGSAEKELEEIDRRINELGFGL